MLIRYASESKSETGLILETVNTHLFNRKSNKNKQEYTDAMGWLYELLLS